LTLLLFQMAAVLLVSLLCGWIASRFGLARVIGEIVGGILIGPSVFGRFAPHASSTLFPSNSLGPFEVLSTVGLISESSTDTRPCDSLIQSGPTVRDLHPGSHSCLMTHPPTRQSRPTT
jgi:hypothetical protein